MKALNPGNDDICDPYGVDLQVFWFLEICDPFGVAILNFCFLKDVMPSAIFYLYETIHSVVSEVLLSLGIAKHFIYIKQFIPFFTNYTNPEGIAYHYKSTKHNNPTLKGSYKSVLRPSRYDDYMRPLQGRFTGILVFRNMRPLQGRYFEFLFFERCDAFGVILLKRWNFLYKNRINTIMFLAYTCS